MWTGLRFANASLPPLFGIRGLTANKSGQEAIARRSPSHMDSHNQSFMFILFTSYSFSYGANIDFSLMDVTYGK